MSDLTYTKTNVLAAVSRVFEVEPADIIGQNRTLRVVRVRQAAMHLMRKLCGASYPQIGAAVDRDHTTVLHGIASAQSWMALNPAFAAKVDQAAAMAARPKGSTLAPFRLPRPAVAVPEPQNLPVAAISGPGPTGGGVVSETAPAVKFEAPKPSRPARAWDDFNDLPEFQAMRAQSAAASDRLGRILGGDR